jgi:uncharacterized membrane protein
MLKTIIISIAMVLITIIGDYLIKKASMLQYLNGWKLLVLGGLLYGISAIGWFYVYRTTKVFTVGAIHSFGIIILTILLSVVIFKEKINSSEIMGLVLGIISLVILLKNYASTENVNEPLVAAETISDNPGMDLMDDVLINGKKISILNKVEEFSREALTVHADDSIQAIPVSAIRNP